MHDGAVLALVELREREAHLAGAQPKQLGGRFDRGRIVASEHGAHGIEEPQMLAARFDNLVPTVGPVSVVESVQHYYKLKALGFEAADLHSDQYTLEPHLIDGFRQRFGGQVG